MLTQEKKNMNNSSRHMLPRQRRSRKDTHDLEEVPSAAAIPLTCSRPRCERTRGELEEHLEKTQYTHYCYQKEWNLIFVSGTEAKPQCRKCGKGIASHRVDTERDDNVMALSRSEYSVEKGIIGQWRNRQQQQQPPSSIAAKRAPGGGGIFGKKH